MSKDANAASSINSSAKTLKTSDSKTSSSQRQWQWFRTPRSIKRLFDRFPLQKYPPNELPWRTYTSRAQHSLYIFTTLEGARAGAPSFNPSCLKWQAYLKFTGLTFTTIPSNNHASPTGALPFLLPPVSTTTTTNLPIPSTKLERWTRERSSKISSSNPHKEHEDPPDLRYDAYLSLLDNRIRNAWLYTLYLTLPNFAAIALPLYIHPTSSNPLVHLSLSHNLREAAKAELLKSSAVIDVAALYRECNSAFSALSELLGEDVYFFDAERPGLFDASVFAYTNLLLDEGMEWRERRMAEMLSGYGNLVRHRERILEKYFP